MLKLTVLIENTTHMFLWLLRAESWCPQTLGICSYPFQARCSKPSISSSSSYQIHVFGIWLALQQLPCISDSLEFSTHQFWRNSCRFWKKNIYIFWGSDIYDFQTGSNNIISHTHVLVIEGEGMISKIWFLKEQDQFHQTDNGILRR